MNSDTLIRRNPELLTADMDGETVMMDMYSGNYYGMNAVGSYIWELLETEQRLHALQDAVMARFDISPEDTVSADTMADDIQVFLAALREQKLVELVSG